MKQVIGSWICAGDNEGAGRTGGWSALPRVALPLLPVLRSACGFFTVVLFAALAWLMPRDAQADRIRLNGRIVEVPTRTRALAPALRAQAQLQRAGTPAIHILVRVSVAAVRMRPVDVNFGRLLEPVGSDAMIVLADQAALRNLAADPRVVAFGPIPSAARVPASQVFERPPPHVRRAGNAAEYIVRFYADVTFSSAVALVNGAGGTAAVVSAAEYALLRRLQVTAAPAAALRVRNNDSVAVMEFAAPPRIALNLTTQQSARIDTVQAAPLSLTGAGTTVGVWDSGAVDCGHQDLAGHCRVRDGSVVLAGVDGNHASHVAGTVAGVGTSAAQAEGMAPGAQIDSRSWDDDVAELNAAGNLASSNHSYGEGIGCTRATPAAPWTGCGTNVARFGAYLDTARTFDTLALAHPFVIVRAAGNDRRQGPAGSQDCAADFDCILPDATGRNLLTVGATTWTAAAGHALANFSGFGPTDDGRIKPDLVSRGVNVTSSIPGAGNNQTLVLQGTSMSSPSVAGAVALLRELGARRNRALTATELRAVLLGTADDTVGGVGPDYRSGWGAIDVAAAAGVVNENAGCVLSRSVTVAQVQEIQFCVRPGTRARVTAHWTDFPGPVLAQDVDLILIDPNGVEHRPWILDPANPGNAATVATVGQRDSRNNTEQVAVATPAGGIWRARLSRSDPFSFINLPIAVVVPSCAPPDADGDGIGDCIDNCLGASNADQHNIDGDSLGDECDDDRDGDGVANGQDNCPNDANPGQENRDRDRFGDICDQDRDGDCAERRGVDRCPDLACGYCGCNLEVIVSEGIDLVRFCNSRGQVPRDCFVDACGGPLGDVLRGLPQNLRIGMGITTRPDGRPVLPAMTGNQVPARFSTPTVTLAGGQMDVRTVCGDLGRILGQIGRRANAAQQLCEVERQRSEAACVEGCPRR